VANVPARLLGLRGKVGDYGVGRVADAMRAVPRRGFLPAADRDRADVDAPIALGPGQTNSQPTTVFRMLQLLDVPGACRVLDVGAGSGWTTALLAHLVGPDGQVIGVELDAELAAWGAGNVRAQGFAWAEVRPALTGVLGWPEAAPYDRILVSAEASQLPQQLVDQLSPGGVMVLPVRRKLLRVHKGEDGELDVSKHGTYLFVPLR
jgi:protein-L-isoaspartate(D-aspartate) O-methyltransferase